MIDEQKNGHLEGKKTFLKILKTDTVGVIFFRQTAFWM